MPFGGCIKLLQYIRNKEHLWSKVWANIPFMCSILVNLGQNFCDNASKKMTQFKHVERLRGRNQDQRQQECLVQDGKQKKACNKKSKAIGILNSYFFKTRYGLFHLPLT